MFFTEHVHSYLYSNKIFKTDIFVFNIEKKNQLATGNKSTHGKNNLNMTFNSIKQMMSK